MAFSSLIKLKSFLWGNDPKDASLLIKLDFTILPYFSLIWFLFGLSRASYGSAYISGMGADLGFKGKAYNYMNTVYLVFYAVCQMPGTSLLTIAPPKYVFVGVNVTWSILTLITFKMTHFYQVILLNGFEGCLSAIALYVPSSLTPFFTYQYQRRCSFYIRFLVQEVGAWHEGCYLC
jgi:ACS family pantothenate transporter-like MFS transporter